eukprot:4827586-Amphidinium_carterae.1
MTTWNGWLVHDNLGCMKALKNSPSLTEAVHTQDVRLVKTCSRKGVFLIMVACVMSIASH